MFESFRQRRIFVEVRNTNSQEEVEKGWLASTNRFLKSPAGGAFLTFLFTAVLGSGITFFLTDAENRRTDAAETRRTREARTAEDLRTETARRLERITQSRSNRRDLIETAAKILTSRRIYAGIFRSAMSRRFPPDEVKSRAADYQKAYVDFNLELFAFREAALDYLGAVTADKFVPFLDDKVAISFGRIDGCLTNAYSAYRKGNPAFAQAVLGDCPKRKPPQPGVVDKLNGDYRAGLRVELDRLQNCITSFEIELAYSIYIENNYDQLDDNARRAIEGKTPNLDPILKIKSDREREARARAMCNQGGITNWVCLRRYNRIAVPLKLAVACNTLVEANYLDIAEL